MLQVLSQEKEKNLHKYDGRKVMQKIIDFYNNFKLILYRDN